MLPYIHILGFFLGQNAAIYTHFWNLIFSEKRKKKKNNNQMLSRILQNFQVNMDTRFLHLEFPEYLGICA